MILSVIIPIFNVELYLDKCLQSFTSQMLNFDEVEIILVNDGSTDDSLQICKQYKENFKNFILIDQVNLGLSAARNNGLAIASGQYAWFVDSDDWVTDESISKIINKLLSSETDVVVVGLGEFKNEKLVKTFITNTKFNGIDVLRDPDFFVGAVVYIMNVDFLKTNDLIFYEGIYHEDEEFTNRMLYLAKGIKFINEIIYCVNLREGSITRSINIKKSFDMLIVISELYMFMKTIEHKDVFYNRIGLLFNNALFNLKYATLSDIRKFDDLYKSNFNYINKCLMKSNRFVYRVEGLLLFILKPSLTYRVLSFFK